MRSAANYGDRLDAIVANCEAMRPWLALIPDDMVVDIDGDAIRSRRLRNVDLFDQLTQGGRKVGDLGEHAGEEIVQHDAADVRLHGDALDVDLDVSHVADCLGAIEHGEPLSSVADTPEATASPDPDPQGSPYGEAS